MSPRQASGELFTRAAGCHATVDQIHCGPYSSGHKTFGHLSRFAMEAPRRAGEIRTLVRRYDADLVYVNGPRLLPVTALAVRKGPPVLLYTTRIPRSPEYGSNGATNRLQATSAACVRSSDQAANLRVYPSSRLRA